MSRTLARRSFATPIGCVIAAADDLGLAELTFDRGCTADHHPHLDQLGRELAAYFAGTGHAFTIPVAPLVGTPFQQRAWAYLATIPYGDRHTYGRQAAGLGDANACRAVGRANGANPVCLVVPCHRVVGADGKLVGFTAGLERKRWLLDHERRFAPAAAGA